jgi:transcriptional regulator with XRE-family HTH domain
MLGERTMEPIAQALAKLLSERQMSQTDLWAAANVSPAVVSLYLQGRRGRVLNNQGAETIEKIARVFDLDPSYFVEYRIWQIRQAVRIYPDLANEVYDVLMAFVARESGGLDNLKSRG